MLTQLIARNFQRLPRRTRLVVATVLFGLVAGAGAVLFHITMAGLFDAGIQHFAKQSPKWFLGGSFMVLVGTSAVSGWLLSQFCPDAAGSGIPQLKLAFWKDFGVVPWRVVWVKFVGGALSVGGGASLGREGPSVQLAGGLASNLAGLLGTAKNERRVAAAAGAAAGLAAAFNTPIASVTFVLEEIIGDLNSRLLGSVLVASVLGALVTHGVLGEQPAFELKMPGAPHWPAYLLTPVVAAVAALAGVAFQRSALGLRLRNRRPKQRVPAWLRTATGGFAVWVIGAAVFLGTGHLGVFGLGYTDLTDALNGQMIWQIAALLLVAKLAATALCYGLGGCGGIFAPTLFFGGMAGTAIAGLFGLFMHLTPADSVTLAVVGMSACLSAVVRAPVTGILIVFEMTHQFAVVPTLMLGAFMSLWIARRFTRENFYDEVLAQDGNHVERIMPVRSLRSWMELPVARIASAKPVAITNLAPEALREVFKKHPFERFPVVLNGELVGVLTRVEGEDALADQREPRLDPPVVCTADMPVREVENRLIESPSHIVIVTDGGANKTGGRMLTLLTLHDVLRAEILQAREHETE